MKRVQFVMFNVLVWTLCVGAARGQAIRSQGLIAEKTKWKTPYYAIDSGVEGPTLLITGGLHGNEPAGYRAAEQIRHWPIRCGKLIVVPRVNSPGLKQNTRWLPGEPKAIRNANRNFPKTGEPNEARSVVIKALWKFMQEQKPDWVVDLHEGFDFNIANPKSDGSSIIYFDTPEMQKLASKIHEEVNATIEDPNRKIVKRSKNGPINGGLVRAGVQRLGAKGFCFETTYQYQPLSTRTRQHRMMVYRLMRELNMVGSEGVNVKTSQDEEAIRVALYDAGGTGGKGVENLERVLESKPAFLLHHVGPADIRAGVLDQFDVVIFPGGSGSKEAKAIGKDGCAAVREFVESGGGYVGICAGAFLATARYDWSLALMNAKTFTGNREIPGVGVKSMWFRGKGTVKMELTEEGKKILGDLPGLVEVRYANGPILSPAGRDDVPDYVPLAIFRSEVSLWEPQKGTMVNTPAIAASEFGKGRAIAISPHPEGIPDLESLVRRAVTWVAGESVTAQQNVPDSGQHVRAENGMVVSASGHASRIGRDVLQRGGNAVDAAVATAFALAVTWPEAGNIGGGGFMMIHPSDGEQPVCIDYRETAPGAATSTMFENDDRRHTRKMVGVPGTVRGLALAHQKYGRLPWRELVLPAADLAKNGFEVNAELASSINGVLAKLPEPPAPDFAELRRIYGKPDDEPWKPGDRMVLKDLAATLRCIAIEGPDSFYTGKIADQIVDEMRRGDGIITKADLDRYEAKVRQPIRGTYRGYDVLGPPPPSSGGICLIQMLNVLEKFHLRSHERYSARNMHIIAEAMRRAFRDRALYLGDSDFVRIPDHLTDKSYARHLAAEIDLHTATSSESLAGEIELAPESMDTTHFSVIDSDGMAVSNTYTLEASWGSRIVVHGAGFLLNNEMGDFNRKPGYTDRKGAIGTIPNRIAPHKRMLSSQTPVIVTREGRVVLVTGSPGGRTIINTVLCVLLNVLEFEMDLPDSVASPRLHHQWFPDELKFEGLEENRYSSAVEQLRAMGHSLKRPGGSGKQGSAHSIRVDLETGTLCGVADQRSGGEAAGY